MVFGILLCILCIWLAIKQSEKKRVGNPQKIDAIIQKYPSVTFIPKSSTSVQFLNFAQNKSILTYFSFQDGIITMKFKNGTVFSKPLKDCVFNLGSDKYGARIVTEKGNDSFVLKELDFSGLKKKEWNTIFTILQNAGTVYGSYFW